MESNFVLVPDPLFTSAVFLKLNKIFENKNQLEKKLLKISKVGLFDVLIRILYTQGEGGRQVKKFKKSCYR